MQAFVAALASSTPSHKGAQTFRLRRWSAAAVCLAVTLSTVTPANSAEPRAGDAASCAEREVLLQVLVEAHGVVPNPASAMLAEASFTITQARAACENGSISDALKFYDRLIAELASVVTYRGE